MKISRLRIDIIFVLIIAFIFFQDRVNAQTVFVTKTGKKYHANGCQYLRKSAYSMNLADATNSGYEACSRCGGGGSHLKRPGQSILKSRPKTSTSLATTRCQGITKKGSQCSRKAKGSSGYCWQHGG